MSIHDDEADFLNDVLIAYSVKEVVDSARRRLLKRVIKINVNQLAVSSKIH